MSARLMAIVRVTWSSGTWFSSSTTGKALRNWIRCQPGMSILVWVWTVSPPFFQGVNSTYETDLLSPVMDCIQELTGDNSVQRKENLTPYRVIADHSRAAAFLIADGVVPGNTGRNYICRMIIRRAARFGSKIGLNKPFLAKTAGVIIRDYGQAFPELLRNQKAILSSITREEQRFQRTVEAGMSRLTDLLDDIKKEGLKTLDGGRAFDLYATLGLPVEITRDIAREEGLDVDEAGFRQAMEEHRTASGAGKAIGFMGGEGVEVYREVLEEMQSNGKFPAGGVMYDPYRHARSGSTHFGVIQRRRPCRRRRSRG